MAGYPLPHDEHARMGRRPAGLDGVPADGLARAGGTDEAVAMSLRQ